MRAAVRAKMAPQEGLCLQGGTETVAPVTATEAEVGLEEEEEVVVEEDRPESLVAMGVVLPPAIVAPMVEAVVVDLVEVVEAAVEAMVEEEEVEGVVAAEEEEIMEITDGTAPMVQIWREAIMTATM